MNIDNNNSSNIYIADSNIHYIDNTGVGLLLTSTLNNNNTNTNSNINNNCSNIYSIIINNPNIYYIYINCNVTKNINKDNINLTNLLEIYIGRGKRDDNRYIIVLYIYIYKFI